MSDEELTTRLLRQGWSTGQWCKCGPAEDGYDGDTGQCNRCGLMVEPRRDVPFSYEQRHRDMVVRLEAPTLEGLIELMRSQGVEGDLETKPDAVVKD